MENHAENTASQKTTPDASFNSLLNSTREKSLKERNQIQVLSKKMLF